MKFKMGKEEEKTEENSREPDSLREFTSTASLSDSTTTTRSKSYPTGSTGIYDVSRMNIRAHDLSGTGVTSLTNTTAAGFAKRAKANAALIRGLLIAFSIPFIAGAIYLTTSEKEINLEILRPEKPAALQTLVEPIGDANRTPAERVALPKPAPQVPVIPEVTVASLASSSAGSDDMSIGAAPLKIVLNYNGAIISPFSVELDENGDEILRTESDQHLAFISMGAFEAAKTISSVAVPTGFATAGPSRPFTLTELERRRILQLRDSAIEIRATIQNFERVAFSRLQTSPNAALVLTDGSDSADALAELRWLRAASFTRDVSGDRSVEKRLLETLKLWAKTYRPTGATIADLPLLDALYAYDQIRHLWSTADQVTIDKFFRDLVDAQFVRMKLEKSYGLEHAAHVRFAIAVGYVTGDGHLQYYGQEQFKNHIQNSTLSGMDSYGHEEVLAVGHLLQTAFVLDRANSNIYQLSKLNRIIDVLVNSSQTTRAKLLETMAVAAYFRQDLYRSLPAAAVAAGIVGSRFGTNEGAILAAIRKPTSTLGGAGPQRVPTALPGKLPAKQTGK